MDQNDNNDIFDIKIETSIYVQSVVFDKSYNRFLSDCLNNHFKTLIENYTAEQVRSELEVEYK